MRHTFALLGLSAPLPEVHASLESYLRGKGELPKPDNETAQAVKSLLEVTVEARVKGTLDVPQWINLANRLKGLLIGDTADQVVNALPRLKGPYEPWKPLLESTDLSDVGVALWRREVIDRKLVKASIRKRVPSLWTSAIFDVYLLNGKPTNLKQLWLTAVKDFPRSPRLMKTHDVLLRCLALDNKGSLVMPALTVLGHNSPLAKRLALSLISSETGIRVLTKVALKSLESKIRWKPGQSRAAILRLLCSTAIELMTSDLTAAGTATKGVALARILFSSSDSSTLTQHDFLLTYLRNLLNVESKDKSIGPHPQQEYLAAMTRGEFVALSDDRVHRISNQDGSVSLEDSSNTDRLLGKISILVPLIELLRSTGTDKEKLTSIKAILFNAHAREAGRKGDRVGFDPRIHELIEGKCSLGEPVKIVEPSWYLGSSSELLLSKAKVERSGEEKSEADQ